MKAIMIVDDEEDICILLASILRTMGYSTEKAYSLTEARLLIRSKNPELLFLDINLNDGNGLEQINELRGNGNFPIIMMSAFDTPEVRKKARESGVRFFLSKPFTRGDVNKIIESIFN